MFCCSESNRGFIEIYEMSISVTVLNQIEVLLIERVLISQLHFTVEVFQPTTYVFLTFYVSHCRLICRILSELF